MHPRNCYADKKPDFGELAEFRPTLKPFLIQKSDPLTLPYAFSLDFSKPAALRELACALLERDFGIKLEIPLDKLIPTVPLRLNYVHWVEDLLGCASGDDGSIPKGTSVVGIDIGTGASCIYPLLGSTLNGWRFLATEIDEEAIKFASDNVSRNGLGDRITVKYVSEGVVLTGAVEPTSEYDFCMCNPPFFKDKVERYGGPSRSSHRPAAGTFSSGSESETVTEGGEVGFVMKIVQDSLKLRTRVRWYTSMLGKKASLRAILDEIKRHQIPVVATTEFVQGKTWRWAIAWSFDETLKTKTGHIVHRPPKAQKRKRPVILQVSSFQPSPEGFQHTKQWLQEQLNGLQIEWYVTGEDSKAVHMHCKAHKNTWSHQRRKKRLLQRLKSKEPKAQPGAATGTGGGSITTGMSSNQSHSKQQTESCPATDECCPSSADTATLGTKTQDFGSEKSKLDKTIVGDAAEAEDPLGFPPKYQQDLEDVYTPCNMEFQCSLLLGNFGEELGAQVGTSKKCKLLSSGEDTIDSQEQSSMIYLSFEWIQGSEKDLLHQITQYFRNKIQNCAVPKLE